MVTTLPFLYDIFEYIFTFCDYKFFATYASHYFGSIKCLLF
ncbi:hypothetical protein HMPREF9144_1090 [Prevotella pallens ATCC 700821]|uniref:Uncharacterized protein n=1 Tax=Prevotella pallens ATCC 700821 TaxID=997353 RepID=F9DHF0_9BACT|nr:hypothetical protein HMPREF9144_1090 [Prevotella pallens ATCC 700821]